MSQPDHIGVGIDATRLVFGAVDRYGAPRPHVEGDAVLEVEGPGEIFGDNPFALADAGGVAVLASHRTLGVEKVTVEVTGSKMDTD